MAEGLPVVTLDEPGLHDRLRELLTRYDVNDYAASV